MQVKEVGSGAAQRQTREKLMKAARRRDIDVVLVWRLGRWGRSVVDLLATLRELEYLGVGFVSPTETLDLTSPAGRAMAGLLDVIAEFEGDVLRERVRAGLAHTRQSGILRTSDAEGGGVGGDCSFRLILAQRIIANNDARRYVAQGPSAPARVSPGPDYWRAQGDRTLPCATCPFFDVAPSSRQSTSTWLRRIPLPAGSFLRRALFDLSFNRTRPTTVPDYGSETGRQERPAI